MSIRNVNVGNTPIEKYYFECNNIFIKREDKNVTGSLKDRSVWYMIKDVIGINNSHFIIATSGNAGISLAYFSKLFNNKCTIFCSNLINQSKLNPMIKLGADVKICDGKDPNKIGGWIYESYNFFRNLDNYNKYYINQFKSKNSVNAHKEGTAEEIFNYFSHINDNLDYIFIGIGSGGTAEGIKNYIRDNNLSTKVIVCEPIGGIFYDTFYGNNVSYIDHNIKSISSSFIPDNISSIHDFDEIIQYKDVYLEDGRQYLFNLSGIYAGDVTSFIFYCVYQYIKQNNLLDKRILILNSEDGLKYIC